MGDTEESWHILVEAERGLTAVAAGEGVGSDNRVQPALSNILPPNTLVAYLEHGVAHRRDS